MPGRKTFKALTPNFHDTSRSRISQHAAWRTTIWRAGSRIKKFSFS
jgi:hypothetical protein